MDRLTLFLYLFINYPDPQYGLALVLAGAAAIKTRGTSRYSQKDTNA